MALAPGSRLGVYQITAAIGEGGMGQVFRARDTKLDRDVAIKILPEAFAHDADRLARFTREAKVLAALNHPNIAHIHGLEESGDITALVMELVEGEDLSQRIARGAIPVDEALPIARQIAEALEAAHEQGIIHRDLKPANIKVRDDGTVKVLDFGLAKAMDPPVGSSPNVSQSPTITTPAMTQAGMILGTAAYMAPEQARGKAVDKRADIWAFGAVLFEMLTGARAFGGEDVAETLANVINKEPVWEALPAMVPAHVRQALRLCLKKAPRERVPDIGAVRLALDGAFETAAPQAPTPTPEPRSRRRFTAALAAAVVAGAVGTALGAWLLRPAPVDTPEVRLQMVTPAGPPTQFAIAPDGRAIVVVVSGRRAGEPQLWLRSLDSDTAQLLPGTEGGTFPFWSPDSRSIGFRVAGVGMKRVDLDGLTTRTIFNGPAVAGTWGADGTILFSAGTTGPLSRVPASGGQPVAATRLESTQQTSHRQPRFLPDGRHFLFYVLGTPEARGVYLGTLDSQETRRLFDADSRAEFVSPDYLMFMRQEALLAQRLNLETLDTIGEPIVVGAGTQTDNFIGNMALSASRAGSLVYRATAAQSHQLVWFDRAGTQIGSIGEPDIRSVAAATLGEARVSPDGSAVALARSINENIDVWLMDTARGLLRRLTSDPWLDRAPVWSPDGSRIVFASMRKGPTDLYVTLASGAAPEEVLLESPINKRPFDWSPDGRFILYVVQDPQTRRDLWALPLDGDRKPFVVAQSAADESNGQFSKDGRWVAYTSDETGQPEVFVKAFPTLGAATRISASGVSNVVSGFPRWSHDGKTIFYAAPDNRLMSVPVNARPKGTLDVGAPVALFAMRPGAQLVASPDGQRFLVNTPLEDAVTPPLTVVLNWKPTRR